MPQNSISNSQLFVEEHLEHSDSFVWMSKANRASQGLATIKVDFRRGVFIKVNGVLINPDELLIPTNLSVENFEVNLKKYLQEKSGLTETQANRVILLLDKSYTQGFGAYNALTPVCNKILKEDVASAMGAFVTFSLRTHCQIISINCDRTEGAEPTVEFEDRQNYNLRKVESEQTASVPGYVVYRGVMTERGAQVEETKASTPFLKVVCIPTGQNAESLDKFDFPDFPTTEADIRSYIETELSRIASEAEESSRRDAWLRRQYFDVKKLFKTVITELEQEKKFQEFVIPTIIDLETALLTKIDKFSPAQHTYFSDKYGLSYLKRVCDKGSNKSKQKAFSALSKQEVKILFSTKESRKFVKELYNNDSTKSVIFANRYLTMAIIQNPKKFGVKRPGYDVVKDMFKKGLGFQYFISKKYAQTLIHSFAKYVVTRFLRKPKIMKLPEEPQTAETLKFAWEHGYELTEQDSLKVSPLLSDTGLMKLFKYKRQNPTMIELNASQEDGLAFYQNILPGVFKYAGKKDLCPVNSNEPEAQAEPQYEFILGRISNNFHLLKQAYKNLERLAKKDSACVDALVTLACLNASGRQSGYCAQKLLNRSFFSWMGIGRSVSFLLSKEQLEKIAFKHKGNKKVKKLVLKRYHALEKGDAGEQSNFEAIVEKGRALFENKNEQGETAYERIGESLNANSSELGSDSDDDEFFDAPDHLPAPTVSETQYLPFAAAPLGLGSHSMFSNTNGELTSESSLSEGYDTASDSSSDEPNYPNERVGRQPAEDPAPGFIQTCWSMLGW